MSNLISDGINWFNERRSAYVSETVVIKTAAVEVVVPDASVIEPESYVDGGLKVQSDKYIFLIPVSYLAGIDIARGVRIFRNNEFYEVVIDKKIQQDYNDPDNTIRAIPAQKRCYSAP